MLSRRLITDAASDDFEFCWELYQDSFPEDERRAREYQVETLGSESYRFEVILKDNEPIGLLGWWDLPDFRYIEHFATSPSVRGEGCGSELLKQFIAEQKKPILLEVEHPLTEINRRRILFYKRLGFKLNDHPYGHPSYRQVNNEWVDLLLMSYPHAISFDELHGFVDNGHPLIHFRNYR